MPMASRAGLIVLGAGLMACASVAAAGESMIAPTGNVLSQDMHLANSLRGDDETIYTTADQQGVYRLRRAPDYARQDLSRDDFVALARTQLVGRTTISPLDYDDGWRVRYMAPDGQVYVWDSKSRKVSHGQWTIAVKDVAAGGKPVQVVQTCATVHADLRLLNYPQFEPYCYPTAHDFAYPEDVAEHGRETRDGDPFGLAQGHKPVTTDANVRPQWPDEVKQ